MRQYQGGGGDVPPNRVERHEEVEVTSGGGRCGNGRGTNRDCRGEEEDIIADDNDTGMGRTVGAWNDKRGGIPCHRAVKRERRGEG